MALNATSIHSAARRVAAGAALLGGVAVMSMPQPAWAIATASADLRDLQWVLTDLAPDDGIAPSITFSGHSYAKAGVGTSPWGPFNNTGGGEIGQPSGTDSGDLASTYGRAGIDPAAEGGYRLQADGRAIDAGRYFNAEVRFEEGACCFLLSAHTRVVFSGLATLQASRTAASIGERAGAEAALVVIGPGVGEVAQLEDGFTLALNSDADPLQSFASRSLQVGYRNDTDDTLWGGFNARASAYGMSFTSAIPEPAHGASLLAGAGLLWLLRRRQLQ